MNLQRVGVGVSLILDFTVKRALEVTRRIKYFSRLPALRV